MASRFGRISSTSILTKRRLFAISAAKCFSVWCVKDSSANVSYSVYSFAHKKKQSICIIIFNERYTVDFSLRLEFPQALRLQDSQQLFVHAQQALLVVAGSVLPAAAQLIRFHQLHERIAAGDRRVAGKISFSSFFFVFQPIKSNKFCTLLISCRCCR